MASDIIFNSSLPRSGSTLLQNILGQNPVFHVTPTSGLIELVVNIRDRWQGLTEFRAQPQEELLPRIQGAMSGVMRGFYEKELADGKVVVDKSRGWLGYTELMQQVTGKPITILTTVRDVRAIAASFEKLYRANPLTVRREADYVTAQTVEGRTNILLSPGGVIGIAVARLRDALRRCKDNKIVIIPYDALTKNPRATLDAVHEEMGMPTFPYDFDNIKQITYEDDSIHGMPLHSIRNKVEPHEKEPWKGIIPDKLADWINKEFADIQELARA